MDISRFIRTKDFLRGCDKAVLSRGFAPEIADTLTRFACRLPDGFTAHKPIRQGDDYSLFL